MMFRYVHFDASGRITQFSTSPFDIEGLAVAKISGDLGAVDPSQWKVDVSSVAHDEDGSLAARLLPEQRQELDWYGYVKLARNKALDACDALMLPHRPIDSAERAAWAQYMQALRDLGVHTTVDAFVAAWPLRPDGADDIADIRARVCARKGVS